MIAEEQNYNSPKVISSSIPLGTTIKNIINSFKSTTPYFKSHISTFTHKLLSEEEQTQEFVNLLRRKTIDLPFLIGQEKRDLYNFAKGRVDFYFYWKEETATTESFFDVEAKILTNRFPNSREKEYVIGDVKNGGIERFKIEKHGKGLFQCGILGFIEIQDSNFWLSKINGWITDLSKSDATWNKDETVKELENHTEFVYLNSVAHRISSSDIMLHHFWIK